jgi:hypothetical protein
MSALEKNHWPLKRTNGPWKQPVTQFDSFLAWNNLILITEFKPEVAHEKQFEWSQQPGHEEQLYYQIEATRQLQKIFKLKQLTNGTFSRRFGSFRRWYFVARTGDTGSLWIYSIVLVLFNWADITGISCDHIHFKSRCAIIWKENSNVEMCNKKW